MEWDAATSWQLRDPRGNYGVCVALIGLLPLDAVTVTYIP